jgi:hypothetical protein
MTALQYRRANSGIDVMQATPVRSVWYALLVCALAAPPAYTAGMGASGGETGSTTQTNQWQDTRGITATDKRDAANRNAPLKGQKLTAGGSSAHGSAPRIAQPAALQRAGGYIPPHGGSLLPVAHVYVSKPAIGAATRAYLRVVRADGPSTALAAARWPSSAAVRGANRPVASLKAAPSNGVIGGVRTPGRGMIGGPVNTRSVLKAGIDGTTLRRGY